MNTEISATERISFWRGAAGIVVSTLFFMLGSFIVALPVTLIIEFTSLQSNSWIHIVQSILNAIVGTWFSRNATDWTLKRYSGRAVFVFYLSLILVLMTIEYSRLPFSFELFGSTIQAITLVGCAYFWFWRRESESPEVIASRTERGKAAASSLLGCLPMILFFTMGVIQYWAIAAELQSAAHMSGWLSGIAAWILTYIPIVGSVVGFFGAKDAWGWQWWQAALLYFGMPIAFFGLAIGAAALGALADAGRRAFRRNPI